MAPGTARAHCSASKIVDSARSAEAARWRAARNERAVLACCSGCGAGELEPARPSRIGDVPEALLAIDQEIKGGIHQVRQIRRRDDQVVPERQRLPAAQPRQGA